MTPGDVIRVLKQRIFLILFVWFVVTLMVVGGTKLWQMKLTTYKAVGVIAVKDPIRRSPMQFDNYVPPVDYMDRILSDHVARVTQDSVLEQVVAKASVIDTHWYRTAKSQGHDSAWMIEELKRNLKVAQHLNTNLIAVSYVTYEPAKDASTIVSAVLDVYLAEEAASTQSESGKKLQELTDQLERTRKRLQQLLEDKTSLAKQIDSPGVTQGLNVVGEDYRSLSQAVTKLTADKLQYQSQYETYRKLAPGQVTISPAMNKAIQEDPQIFQYTNYLMELEQQLENRLRRVGPEHREIRQLKDQIQTTKDTLARIQADKEKQLLEFQVQQSEQAYLSAAQAEHSLRNQLETLAGRQADIDSKMASYRNLEDQVASLQEEVRQLQMFHNQYSLVAESKDQTPIQVYPVSVPREPFWPKPMITIPAGSMLGLIFGVALALFLEVIDTSLRTSRDVPRHVHVPILGTIPDVDDEEVTIEQVELASRTAPRSMVAEAFRTVRTNLLLSSPAERQRTVLVASARPEEGRTTVAINLALSLAQSGRRVLLVDANFHRPAIQRFFPRAEHKGFSNVLIGQARLADVVVTTDLPNLDVLPSGPIPPNPTELLAGTYLRKMIAEAQDSYDQIVFDGPPVLLVSDGLVLAGVVDGIILVCRAKTTTRGIAMRGREQLERVNGRIFGAVLNAAQVARGGYFREQIRSYYDYQPEESLTATTVPVLPKDEPADKA
jgi:capsular exopolysaccharide synthesis family protein